MSVRTDVVNLIVNVGGDAAQEELNDLRKKAADLSQEMKTLHKKHQRIQSKSSRIKRSR